ncbi:MAG: hypothetical protein ACI9JN_002509 [Bacteroidia bacterium]|jgi:hypothetical protein
MTTSIFRTIGIGLLLGLLAFVAFRFIIVLAILGLIFKLSGKGRWKRDHWRKRKLAFVDHVRNMDTDDYESFKSNYGKHHCYQHPETSDTAA